MKILSWFGVFILSLCLQACFQPEEDGTSCPTSEKITMEKILTPSDRDFVLETEDSAAVLNNYCRVHFTLTAAFVNDSLQALVVASQSPFALPLSGMGDTSLFFLNDSSAFVRNWRVMQNVSDSAFDGAVRITSEGAPPHPMAQTKYDRGHGKYSIRTQLPSGVSNPDSSVRVRGEIRYLH